MTSSSARRPRRSSEALGALLFVLLLATPVVEGKRDGFEVVATGAEPLVDAAGDRVAWARRSGQRLELLTTELHGGGERVEATVLGQSAAPLLHDLAYDGRYLAWIDDRFGLSDAFVVDTQTGAQTRLTHDGVKEGGVDVNAGIVAWGTTRALGLRAMANATTWFLPVGGDSSEPALLLGGVAWAEALDRTRTLMLDQAGAAPSRVDGNETTFAWHPSADDGLLAWQLQVLADEGARGVAGASVRILDASGRPQAISPVIPGLLGPWVGASRVAWIQSDASGSSIRIWWPEGNLTLSGVSATDLALTGSHLVIVDGQGLVQTRPWSASAAVGLPGTGAVLLAGLLVALAARRR